MNEYDYELHLDKFTIEEIYCLVDMEIIDPDYPAWFYNNSQWDEEVETEYDEAYIAGRVA